MIYFVFLHIYLSKCSHLCIKLPSSFISLWEACSWFTNQLNMTRMFTLLPGSSWTWGWCFCLLGGTELLLCFSSPPSLQLQELLFSWCSLPPDKTTLLVLLAGGEVGFLNLYLVRYLYFAHSYRFPSLCLHPGHWTTLRDLEVGAFLLDGRVLPLGILLYCPVQC